MNLISVADTARRVGVSERTVYDLIQAGALRARGTPLRVDEGAVEELLLARRGEAAARVGDLERFAVKAVAALRTIGVERSWTPTHTDAVALFGAAAVKAARMQEGSGCRWCWARMTAAVHGGLMPGRFGFAAYRVLLGEPCAVDMRDLRRMLSGAEKAAAGADEAQPAARTEPPQGPGPKQRPAAPERARTASGKRRRKACGTAVGWPCLCHDMSGTRAAEPIRGPRSITASTRKPEPKKRPAPKRAQRMHGCGCRCAGCEATR
ncbi:helix-turn-helix domain-containing protein [Streptomyces iconiensis]|uniref:Helix-turn-helix domain-containing protein n=1 Tax=Streptomyces iconiensis TaxID=1384038 RepID=A0ABT6ZSJ8_9ACTN|nr:helix-turn-helix domain-containing protein [Streptomyces iconiensis]MDJ1131769.1 helix-turn-helix domain-containing protein [Streptomyces iconiensis]